MRFARLAICQNQTADAKALLLLADVNRNLAANLILADAQALQLLADVSLSLAASPHRQFLLP